MAHAVMRAALVALSLLAGSDAFAVRCPSADFPGAPSYELDVDWTRYRVERDDLELMGRTCRQQFGHPCPGASAYTRRIINHVTGKTYCVTVYNAKFWDACPEIEAHERLHCSGAGH